LKKSVILFLFLVVLLSTCGSVPLATSVITLAPIAGDDTANIQRAFNKLCDGLGNWCPGLVTFAPGTYEVNGTLDLKQKYRAIIEGQGAILTGNFSINASGSYMTIRDLNLHSTSPNPAFIYGRDVNGSGGWMVLENVDVISDNQIGAVLFGMADLSKITDSEIYNGGNAPALILTSENETGLLDYAASTETLVTISDCYIHGGGDVLVSMRGLVQNVTFDTVYFMPNGAAVELTSGQAHGVSFRNSRSEGLENAVLLRTLPGTIAEGFYFQQYIHAVINADYVLDIQGTATQFTRDFISLSNSSTQVSRVTGSLLWAGDENKQPDKRIVNSSFSYAAPVLQMDNANLTHLAQLEPYQKVIVVFDGTSTIGGGYFSGLPSDPYQGKAGEVMELISLNSWYWTVIR
jgi:hypothetical protein